MQCIYIHARLATPMNGSPMRAHRMHAPTCCARARARVRVRLGAHASAPTHASAFRRRRPHSASARRRSVVRLRLTLTSARGTPRGSPRCTWYSPPSRLRRRATSGGSHSAGRRCGAGPLCAAAPPRRARVCVHTCGHACARVCSCDRVRSRAIACGCRRDARMRGMCASATSSLRKAIHRWNSHRYSI